MKIFIISLKGHERRKAIQQCLNDLTLEFEFFDAVDGSNLSLEHKKSIDEDQTNIPRSLTKAEYASALSHVLLYQKIVTEKIPHALILEDDASAPKDLKLMLDAHVLENSDFDLVMLCYANAWSRRWSFKPFFKQFQSFKLWNAPYRTTAYYINKNAAENLNNAAVPISATADWPIGAFNTIKTACLHPQVIIHPKSELVESMLNDERQANELRYQTGKKKRSFFSKYKHKLLTSFFIPKRNNFQLPHFWLKLLGKKIAGQ